MQTALDLLDLNFQVFLVCDAVSSQRCHDRATAIDRMKASGVTLTTSESVLFDIMKSADHRNFKAISAIVKETNALEDEFRSDLTP